MADRSAGAAQSDQRVIPVCVLHGIRYQNALC